MCKGCITYLLVNLLFQFYNIFVLFCSDPNGREVAARVSKTSTAYAIEFTPQEAGPHSIDVKFGNMVVPGSPFVCNVYNSLRATISDMTSTAEVGKEIGFTVDTSKAGFGDVDVEVTSGSSRIGTQVKRISDSLYRYSFIPRNTETYTATVTMNGEQIPGMSTIHLYRMIFLRH